MTDRWPCPCCGHLTLPEGPGNYELCGVCFWEDDPAQLRWPMSPNGANGVSLVEAQATYQVTGVMHPEFRDKARRPRTDEPVDHGWRPLDVSRDWFEANPPPDHDAVWPRDSESLYWWRPTYWNGLIEDRPIEYGDQPAHLLMRRLREAVPEAADGIDRLEHSYGRPVPFAVCGWLTSFVLEAYVEGRNEIADRVVAVLDSGLQSGDGETQTCVAVGFLEDEELHSEWMQDLIERWPPSIREELQRQHRWRAKSIANEGSAWWRWRLRSLTRRVFRG